MKESHLQKCIFLDRDGVLNKERGEYTFRTEDFEILPDVPHALKELKDAGYLLIVITNQGGIAKGLYAKENVFYCHEKLQEICCNLIDALYYAPAHPSKSESLARKPDSLMLEKAIAKYNIDPLQSWFIGDQLRDMQAAEKVQIPGILISKDTDKYSRVVTDLKEAAGLILKSKTE